MTGPPVEAAAALEGAAPQALEDLADRCLLVGFTELEPPDWLRRAAPRVGGVVLYGQNVTSDGDVARLARVLRADADVLIAVDEEGGDVTRVHYRGGSPTPGNWVLGRADDVAMTAAVAGRIGAELRSAGVGLNLAPDADVNVDPDNPVIGVRSFGADPALVSRHTAAWVRALQAAGVAACAKHFPGHGDTRVDSHHGLPVVGCDEREWRRVHLPPFAAAVAAGVTAVMTAHVRIPALDAVPATVSRRILVDLLRHELGFAGVIVTDALDMAGISAGRGDAGAAVAALAAGADALCLGAVGGEAQYQRVRAAVAAAVRAGDLPRARLAEAAARVSGLPARVSGLPARVSGLPARVAPPAADPALAAARGDPGLAAARGDPGLAAARGDPGLAAARSAAVAHRIRPLADRPVLLELRAVPNPAVGAAGWDLGGPLADLGRPPLRTVRITAADAGALGDAALDALTAAGPPVVVGRDVVRHDWQRLVWDRVRARRADAVLVDLGLPRPDRLPDAPYVLVCGAARPNLQVAAEILVAGRP